MPVISKIFENAMHTQLMEYFTFHNLLANQQYGFRPNRSTELKNKNKKNKSKFISEQKKEVIS